MIMMNMTNEIPRPVAENCLIVDDQDLLAE
jgi:hypothetical protein